MNGQHGKIVVHRSAGCAAIQGETNLADAPGQLCRTAVFPGVYRGINQSGFELFGVLEEVVPVVVGNGLIEESIGKVGPLNPPDAADEERGLGIEG